VLNSVEQPPYCDLLRLSPWLADPPRRGGERSQGTTIAIVQCRAREKSEKCTGEEFSFSCLKQCQMYGGRIFFFVSFGPVCSSLLKSAQVCQTRNDIVCFSPSKGVVRNVSYFASSEPRQFSQGQTTEGDTQEIPSTSQDKPPGSRPGPLSRTRRPIVWSSPQSQQPTTSQQPSTSEPQAQQQAPDAPESESGAETQRGRRGRLRLMGRTLTNPRRGTGWRGGRGGTRGGQ
jgi:hypothetical protein